MHAEAPPKRDFRFAVTSFCTPFASIRKKLGRKAQLFSFKGRWIAEVLFEQQHLPGLIEISRF
jgi:hypothetical protein